MVCVCNETYCDGFKSIPKLEPKQYVVYTSTKDGLRFSESVLHANQNYPTEMENVDVKLHINSSKTYQSILGFGGAFTGNEIRTAICRGGAT